MDYRTASGLRKKSLSDLITERLLQTTTTLPTDEGGRPTTTKDYSIGGAIRSSIGEKIKASATGLKEKFDPMNIARALTGGSPLAAALVGRMTGRKSDSIDYFAGKGKKKRAGRKDPDYSSIGDGATAKLRVGDSYSDVLAKMFLFLQHAQEFDKLSYELEKDFREEQRAEDERRHKKLVATILKVRREPPKEQKDNTESFLEKLMEKIKSMFSGVWDAVKFLGGMGSNIIGGITKTIERLKDDLLTGMVATSTFVTKKILKLALGAVVDSLSFMLPGVGKVIGKAILAGLAAAGIAEGIEEYQQSRREAFGGKDAEETYQEIQKYEGSWSGTGATGPTDEAAQKIKELTEKRNKQISEHQSKYMDPTMTKLGWTKEGYEKDSAGNELFDKPIYTRMEKGKKVTAGILDTPEILSAGVSAHMRGKMDYSDALRTQQEQLRQYFGPNQTESKVEPLKPEPEVEMGQSASALAPVANQSSYTIQSPVDIANRILETKPDVVVSAKRPVSVSTTNNIGGQGETFKTAEAVDVRNRDKAYNHSTSAAVFAR